MQNAKCKVQNFGRVAVVINFNISARRDNAQ